MTDHYDSPPEAFNPAKATQRQAEIDRAVPITGGDPAYHYWTATRGLPAEVVLTCSDLRWLPAPIPGCNRALSAVISVLRPAPDADPTGAEVAFVDALGAPAADDQNRPRVSWKFVADGCRDAWLVAGGTGATALSRDSVPRHWR
jgi:hypothetical protein